MSIWIRIGNEEELIPAEQTGATQARLVAIPRAREASPYDLVRFDPATVREENGGKSFAMSEVVEPSGYRAYLTWAVLHRPARFVEWREKLAAAEVLVEPAEWISDHVRNLIVALPPQLSPLAALVLLKRHSPTVEIICPLLAAHADDVERSKSDLERAVSWGANDAELTYAIAEAFEEQGHWDEATPFWERLTHIMPQEGATRERLAINYARLGVFPQAANEFDRAAHLADDLEHRARLLAARDLMWEQSKV